MPDLVSQATQAALAGDWEKAAKLNSDILTENPRDIEASNRLAHALCSLGKTKEAKKTYQQTLSIDPYNHIALKNLKKLNVIQDKVSETTPESTPCLFLEEPGKTKITSIVNPAPQKMLSCLSPGATLNLIVKKHSILIFKNHEYVGALPDDLAHRLIHLSRLGNKYQAFVKAVEENNLQVFLQEVKRSRRAGNQPSFPPSKNNGFYPFVYSKQALNIDKEPPEASSDDEETEENEEKNGI